MSRAGEAPHGGLRRRVYAVLEAGGASGWGEAWVRRLLVALVFVSVAGGVLNTVPDVFARWGLWLERLEIFALCVFWAEYVLRVWSAPEHTRYSELHPWRARWRLMREPLAVIDLLTILPLFVGVLFAGDFQVLLALRLLRFFKLARYSPGMRSLALALQTERRALGAAFLLLSGLVLLTASGMYLLEREAQPDKLGSIPAAMWWSIVTLTTVGYGDVIPVTVGGRMLAGVTSILGLVMLAMPVGVLATAFSQEIHRREFIVTWSMLARVPLFSHLTASEIGEIMDYLRAQTVPANTLVLRKGDVASCIYLVASGEVEVDTPEGPVRLGEGHFFGEIALLRGTKRTADVRAVEPTRLLVLDADDLSALMERDPVLRRRLESAADARRASTPDPEGEQKA
ncbi:MAG: cyclic nucleotide-binding protein [Hyphomicrobiales bacterium]|nr:cyclic nucleotide-binding protein [Hyphomicrobiales bacterium]